ncbi:hypothetical protein ETB97_005144 [Aspergillus alliaceus]|uniref:Major facilitator superfamily (MFS) profile domain-containing protein n=1 Tax=Petromyces alliaceus TaxID=209559 RepID=A0A8H5ZZ60_PETAA|nr:hypothetical protein ETB97_005144 [Aspergillus burnettii]
MALTHLPAPVLLAVFPLSSTLSTTLALLGLCGLFQNIDIAPRGAFIPANLPPDRRTDILGVINMAKSCGLCLGPLVTGKLADHQLLGYAFILAGTLKIVYDLGVPLAFYGRDSLDAHHTSQGCEDE